MSQVKRLVAGQKQLFPAFNNSYEYPTRGRHYVATSADSQAHPTAQPASEGTTMGVLDQFGGALAALGKLLG